MPSQDKLFLTASVDASNALTDLFDFVWPTAVALWNLQWQTKGFIEQMPTATIDDLHSRFALGSGIRGANLKRLAKEKSWPEMQQRFARILLSETCALFEGWIEAALDELKIPASIRQARSPNAIDNLLQFPTKLDAAGKLQSGVMFGVSKVQGLGGSAFMQSCILPTLINNQKNSLAALERLLVCYRAFKEVRNDFTHHGGRASKRAVKAFTDYSNESASTLRLKEIPELPVVAEGIPIDISLRGIVGFGDVVLRLIATLDCLLANSTYAESVITQRWIAKHKGLVTVKAAGPKRDAQLVRLIKQCALPSPVELTVLYAHLNNKRLAV